MKLGIIGSGKIVHDFLTIADQIPNLELTALATTKRSHQIGLDLQKNIRSLNYTIIMMTYLMILTLILFM